MFKIKKLTETAKLPVRAFPTDSGLDLFSDENCVIKSGEWRAVSTGISMSLPEGLEGQVRPKSGIALKNGVTVLNSPGTVDQSFRGEVKVILINHSQKDFHVFQGNKIAQLVIAPVNLANPLEVTDLDDTSRGDGGFGSTGV